MPSTTNGRVLVISKTKTEWWFCCCCLAYKWLSHTLSKSCPLWVMDSIIPPWLSPCTKVCGCQSCLCWPISWFLFSPEGIQVNYLQTSPSCILAFIFSLPPVVMLFPLFDPQLPLSVSSQVDQVNFVAVAVSYSVYNDSLFLSSFLGCWMACEPRWRGLSCIQLVVFKTLVLD